VSVGDNLQHVFLTTTGVAHNCSQFCVRVLALRLTGLFVRPRSQLNLTNSNHPAVKKANSAEEQFNRAAASFA
jgi:hypothetical protein